MEPPLLMPITDPEEAKTQAMFTDRYGEIVALANNILVASARLAACEKHSLNQAVSYYECFPTQVWFL